MKKILIAEDNDSNYILMTYILKKHYEYDRARNGQEAVEMVKNSPFDLMRYDLVKADPEMIKVWIEQTGIEEYGRWLEDSMKEGADIYTLKDELQELGEVAIFY